MVFNGLCTQAKNFATNSPILLQLSHWLNLCKHIQPLLTETSKLFISDPIPFFLLRTMRPNANCIALNCAAFYANRFIDALHEYLTLLRFFAYSTLAPFMSSIFINACSHMGKTFIHFQIYFSFKNVCFYFKLASCFGIVFILPLKPGQACVHI